MTGCLGGQHIGRPDWVGVERVAYNEAEGEPRVALDDMAAVVSAVMALTDDPLVAFDLLPEGVLSTGEYQTHCGVCQEMCIALEGRRFLRFMDVEYHRRETRS